MSDEISEEPKIPVPTEVRAFTNQYKMLEVTMSELFRYENGEIHRTFPLKTELLSI